MFRSRNEWFAHELQNHRREWRCYLCSELHNSESSLSSHVSSKHAVAATGAQLQALILKSEEPIDRVSTSACMLCDEWETNLTNPNQDARRAFLNQGQSVKPYGTLGQFRRHLGRHMEQLALFALPMDETTQEEDERSDEVQSDDSPNLAQVQNWREGSEGSSSNGSDDIDENSAREGSAPVNEYPDLPPERQPAEQLDIRNELGTSGQTGKREESGDGGLEVSPEFSSPSAPSSPPRSSPEARFPSVQIAMNDEEEPQGRESPQLDVSVRPENVLAEGERYPIPAGSSSSTLPLSDPITTNRRVRDDPEGDGYMSLPSRSQRKAEETERHERARREAEDQEIRERHKRAQKAYELEQAKKEAKEKKEKDYQGRLEDDPRKSGLDERQIEAVLKEMRANPNRPTYTRMSRRQLSIETLNRYRIDYELDMVSNNSDDSAWAES